MIIRKMYEKGDYTRNEKGDYMMNRRDVIV